VLVSNRPEEATMITTPSATAPSRDDAIARIRSKRAFFVGLGVYVSVNAVLVLIWALTRDDGVGFWPIWPIGLWGIGVLAQAWHAFGPGSGPISEARIEREMQRGS
jgi:hypothetical protein